MNTNRLVPILCLTVTVLILAGAGLVWLLIKNPVPEPPPLRPGPSAPQPPAVAETVIELSGEEKASATVVAGPAEKIATPAPSEPTQQPAETLNKKSISEAGIGKVAILAGSATAQNPEGRIRNLEQGNRLFLNDSIETGKDTRLRIALDDGTVIEQGQLSTLVLDLYVCSPNKPEESAFAGRVLKGLCRIITGLITKLNPEHFTIKTRMITVGIRGCDIAVKSADVDSVYILGLGDKEKVVISLDPAMVAGAGQQELLVERPGMRVDVAAGKGISTPLSLGQAEIRALIAEASPFPPVQHEIVPGSDQSEFRIEPSSPVQKKE